MAKKSEGPRTKPLKLPREWYLPEFGPAPTKVKRPSHVLEIPPELYLREGGRPKRDDKK